MYSLRTNSVCFYCRKSQLSYLFSIRDKITLAVPDPGGGGGHRGQLPPLTCPQIQFLTIIFLKKIQLILCKDSMIPPISMVKIQELLGSMPRTPIVPLLLDPAARIVAARESMLPRKHPLWIRPWLELVSYILLIQKLTLAIRYFWKSSKLLGSC